MTMGYIIFSSALTLVNIVVITWVILKYIPAQHKTFAERQEIWIQIQNVCKDLISESVVQRCMVVKLTNGGGEPLPGKKYYATALVGEVDNVLKHHPVRYDALEVDHYYVSMVLEVKKNKRILLLVESMQFCMLRDFYKGEGVKFAEIHYLCSTQDATFFISYASYDEIHLQPAWGAMQIVASDIRKLLKKAYPLAK